MFVPPAIRLPSARCWSRLGPTQTTIANRAARLNAQIVEVSRRLSRICEERSAVSTVHVVVAPAAYEAAGVSALRLAPGEASASTGAAEPAASLDEALSCGQAGPGRAR